MNGNQRLLAAFVPFVGFCIAGWYGLMVLVQSKRDLKRTFHGLDQLEELDPLEKLRRKFKLDEGPPISSLEEELEAMYQKVKIDNFEYKSVPRPADE